MRVMVGSWFTDVPFHVRSYAVEVDFKPLAITPEVVVNDTKRIEARKAIKKMFQERYTQGKNKWFFSKLRF
jgi:large subunit ribosomal protein L27e